MKKQEAKKTSLGALVQTTMPMTLTDPAPPSRDMTVLPTRTMSEASQAQARGVVKTLQEFSREDSVFESDDPQPVLQPRAPTSMEWSRSGRDGLNSESGVVEMQEMLKQLDQQALTQRRQTLQSENRMMIAKPTSWEGSAEKSMHIWFESDTREACYLHETQFCQDQKKVQQNRTVTGGRIKVRCSACKILVHTACIKQLYYQDVTCKPTFRDIKQKVKNTNVLHHFLRRRKLSGKCAICGRGFGNWKTFSGREFVGYSCSWCGDSYHDGCFKDTLREDPCHLGPLRNMIIPPSWIIKLPPPETEHEGEGAGPFRRKKTTRKRSKRRSVSDDKASKHFTVKPLAISHNKPILVFINPKSGGNQGLKLLQILQGLLNPRQIFDLSQGGPKFGLQLFKNCSNIRILACGGDGTAGWVLSILDQLQFKPYPPVAVLPLGTGNDLARVLGWGGAYGDEPLESVLMHVEDGDVVQMDRWMLSVWPHPEVKNPDEYEGKDDVPLHVINNYFSIGCDAQVALDFHESREANPQKYNNRFTNKFFYSRMAGQDIVLRKFANLTDHLELKCDGEDLTPLIRQLRLEAICFLNINSYGAGTNPWGTPSGRDRERVGPQAINDGMIEIVGFWSSTFPKLVMNLAHGERIAQCQHIKLKTTTSLPVQIDGEACRLKPSILEVVHQNKANMIKKGPLRSVQHPFSGVGHSHQLKMSVSKVSQNQYDRLNNDLSEIHKAAEALGLVVTRPGDSLKSLRVHVDQLFASNNKHIKSQMNKEWRFLDVAFSGRVDRVFQVLVEQEENIIVGDMLSDGILVVELDAPTDEEEESTLDKAVSSGYKRSRKPSYENAVTTNSTMSPVESPPVIYTPAIVTSELGLMAAGDSVSLSSSPPHSPTEQTLSDNLSCDTDPEIQSDQLLLPGVDLASESASDSDSGPSLSNLQKELFHAVKRGNLEKVKELNQRGARLAYVDNGGFTPLHHAARLGMKDTVAYLVEKMPKEALDLQDEERAQTALHKAAWYGYRTICKMLVDAGSSLSRTDYQGNTPYLKAQESGDIKLQQYLRRKEEEQKGASEEGEATV